MKVKISHSGNCRQVGRLFGPPPALIEVFDDQLFDTAGSIV